MENSLTVRHYVPEQDLSILSHMLTEIEAIDHDGEDTSEEYLRSMNKWTNFDPDRNIWVAELKGKFVGYGQAHPIDDNLCSIYVVVHPAHRRKGLGSHLLELVLTRARQAGSNQILVYANGHNTASNAFLKHHEFELAGTLGVMGTPAN
jgi:ribosomal protein S18 acetylase RimI-like enzyme